MYICQKFSQELAHILQQSCTRVVFGNKHEVHALAATFTNEVNEETTVEESVRILMRNSTENVMFVTTCGKDCRIVVGFKGELMSFKHLPSPSAGIVDATAAGDAFAGGFLANYIAGAPLERCVVLGFQWAEKIIHQEGCEISKTLDSSLIFCKKENCSFCAKFNPKLNID